MNGNNTIRTLVSAIALVSVTACVPAESRYTGAAYEKRNEVRMVRLTHAVQVSGARRLGDDAAETLDLFLSENRVGYGDILSLDAGDGPASDNDSEAIRGHLLKRGLRLGASRTIAGALPSEGTVVLVVDRYVVTTPNCNDWSMKYGPNYANAESSAFGCSSRAVLGQMVANPQDLVQGQEEDHPNAAAATNAVEIYIDGAGAGSGGTGGSSRSSGSN